VGVIPEALVRKEVAHKSLTELHVTQSMHEKSKGQSKRPGSNGTTLSPSAIDFSFTLSLQLCFEDTARLRQKRQIL
jgi:hypothetical protein